MKIPVSVYVWECQYGTPFSFGHASISLSDGTYISWWPTQKSSLISKAFGTTGTYIRSLEEDISLQNNRRPEVFKLTSCVDEDAIQRWWRDFRTVSSYSGIYKNCCYVVFHALVSGTVFQLFPDDKRRYWKAISLWRQSHLKRFLNELRHRIEEHEERKLERFICSICHIIMVGLLGLVLSMILTFIIGLLYSLT
ncbi:hypothetical protein ACJMK2_014644 [Sinanodonta woodiana]|uniref:Uncharacterized protein n=1 Tax=Sinanodonta woodiana TaxID=1069815 RepID=A0ABD3V4E5_SINWO